MIDLTSLSSEWLTGKKKQSGKDPGIIEGMIYALYLLERLKLSGLEFIFKGGTSLILLLEQPKRFSVDIDILVNPEIDRATLERYLTKVIDESEFLRVVLDERRSYQTGLPKAHYKFIYTSNCSTKTQEGILLSNPEREILLDIVFTESRYPITLARPIQSDWLKLQGDPVVVTTPDVNSIAGEKLTAFAPNTTGVPYNMGKEKEILKQLFDIGCIFDLLTDLKTFRASFNSIVVEEIHYRPERNITAPTQVLQDIIDTAKLISTRGIGIDEELKPKFEELGRGISQLGYYVYVGNFRIEEAQLASAKAAYLAAILLSEDSLELQPFDEKIPQSDYMIKHPDFNFLNKRLKFVAKGEALYYWFQVVQLLYAKQSDTPLD